MVVLSIVTSHGKFRTWANTTPIDVNIKEKTITFYIEDSRVTVSHVEMVGVDD